MLDRITHRVLLDKTYKRLDMQCLKLKVLCALTVMAVLISPCLAKKKGKHDLNIRFQKSPYLLETLETYINNHDLDPIEGVWSYSYVSISETVLEGKRNNGIDSGKDCDEFYIVKDDLHKSNEYLMVYKSKLDSKKGHTYLVPGDIAARVIPDVIRSDSYYFSFDYGLELLGTYEVYMTLNGDEVRGTYDNSFDKYGVKIRLKSEYVYRRVSNNKAEFSKKDIFSGTGFLISDEGYVVTNYHIIENGKNITVSFPHNGKTYKAHATVKDKNNDLALLKIDGFALNDISNTPIPYSVMPSNLTSIGNTVFTLGYPLSDVLGSSIKYSSGFITSSFDNSMNPVLMQIDNNIQPGNSGSPLFNSDGNIIGIVVSSLNASYFLRKGDFIPQNVNFAIRSDYLQPLLNSLNIKPVNQTLASKYKLMAIEDKISTIKPFISIIYTERKDR
ncbi:MAG TPA: serine protease [Candidatus Cloacimonadota bacterium]|nr:serine protease [Candidatus Cloacimonadota bacterium]HQO44084.1 serine protease [Candidatus Cloacimonadota bacterium]HQP17794.1 serine protease [Candidatus Cloacimonadota bacterium]HRS50675.1 serine protease [Candidatus Cloacimonadota bacterium]